MLVARSVRLHTHDQARVFYERGPVLVQLRSSAQVERVAGAVLERKSGVGACASVSLWA